MNDSKKNPWLVSDRERVRSLVAAGLTAREVSAQVGHTRKAVISFVASQKLGPWLAKPGSKPGDTRHIPEDFAERWKATSQYELALHYHRSASTIGLWVKRLGLKRPVGRNLSTYEPKPVIKTAPKPNAFTIAPIDRPYRDPSFAGRAADFLRRFGAVYRCKSTGRADPAGSHWRRGSAILTDAEIVERAKRNGWPADAWELAA